MAGDQIFLSHLKVDGKFGVSERERRREQTLDVDVTLTLDVSCAAATDDVADAVSYSDVSHMVVALADERQYNLLETFAVACAEKILASFPVTGVKVRVRKSHPLSSGFVEWAGVEVERSK